MPRRRVRSVLRGLLRLGLGLELLEAQHVPLAAPRDAGEAVLGLRKRPADLILVRLRLGLVLDAAEYGELRVGRVALDDLRVVRLLLLPLGHLGQLGDAVADL